MNSIGIRFGSGIFLGDFDSDVMGLLLFARVYLQEAQSTAWHPFNMNIIPPKFITLRCSRLSMTEMEN